jgi:hypothetical protein
MATIDDYADGSITESIRKTLRYFRDAAGPLGEDEKALRVRQKIEEFEPLLITLDAAVAYIGKTDTVAIGERVCRILHAGSAFTESVFLDDLASAMIRSGRARKATAAQAAETLEKSSGHPFIISRVSGKHQEICASVPSECLFWKAEKKGLHCLKRKA